MLSHEEKLELFINAVTKLNPKAHVDNPMNTRHSGQFQTFEAGIEVGYKMKKGPVKLYSEDMMLMRNRVRQAFSTAKTLFVYQNNDDKSFKFRAKNSFTLNNDVYYAFLGEYSTPDKLFETNIFDHLR